MCQNCRIFSASREKSTCCWRSQIPACLPEDVSSSTTADQAQLQETPQIRGPEQSPSSRVLMERFRLRPIWCRPGWKYCTMAGTSTMQQYISPWPCFTLAAQVELALNTFLKVLAPLWLHQQVHFTAPTSQLAAWNEAEHAKDILTTKPSPQRQMTAPEMDYSSKLEGATVSGESGASLYSTRPCKPKVCLCCGQPGRVLQKRVSCLGNSEVIYVDCYMEDLCYFALVNTCFTIMLLRPGVLPNTQN